MKILEGHERRWIEKNLEDHDIEFVVVGGIAVKFYCPDRVRNDVDLFIGADRAKIERLVARVRGFPEKALPRLLCSTIGHAEASTDGLKIDLFSFVPALDWDEAWQTATLHEENGTALKILNRDLLFRHKQAVCQPSDADDKDRSDLELLRKAISEASPAQP